MSNRDEFPDSIKKAVAARASWHCSFPGCAKPTVGPSEESPDGVIMVGKAAHISGAAPGKGSRRYDPSMSPEERKSIANAIWLCSYHADVIDRDEVTYSIEKLSETPENKRLRVHVDFDINGIGRWQHNLSI